MKRVMEMASVPVWIHAFLLLILASPVHAPAVVSICSLALLQVLPHLAMMDYSVMETIHVTERETVTFTLDCHALQDAARNSLPLMDTRARVYVPQRARREAREQPEVQERRVLQGPRALREARERLEPQGPRELVELRVPREFIVQVREEWSFVLSASYHQQHDKGFVHSTNPLSCCWW